MIYFQRTGLDYSQIGYLLAIWGAAVILLEVPSGLVADLWSRRGILGIAMFFKAAGFLVWLLRPDFFGFALGFVLWGVQEAFTTGTTDAVLYDMLKDRGREDRFVKISGRGALMSRLGIIVSVLLGGWVFSRSVTVVLALSALSMAIAGVCPLFFPPQRGGARHRDGMPHEGDARSGDSEPVEEAPEPPSIERVFAEILESARAARAVPGIIPLVLFGSFAFVVYGVLDEYDFIFGTYHGVPVALIGLWGGTRFLLEGIGSALAHRLEKHLDPDRPERLVAWVVAASLLLILGVVSGLKVLLPFYFLFYAAMAAGEVIYQGGVQNRIESAGRATISSFFSLVYELSGLLIILLLGWTSQRLGLPALFLGGAAIAIATAVIYGAYLVVRRR